MPRNREKVALEVDANTREAGAKVCKFGEDVARAFKKIKERADMVDGSFAAIKIKTAAMTVALTGSVVAIRKATESLTDFVNVASDLEEVSSKFDTVFKGHGDQAGSWVKQLQDDYSMSKREAKEYLSTMQDLLVPMGMMSKESAILSNEMVKLSADLGSFNNKQTAQVMDDMTSAIVGNYETMKKYGVVLSATKVEERALAEGYANSKKELTAAHKALAAYQLIVEGSTAAIGDMARTQNSYANQKKKMLANFEDLKAVIGNEFLPIATNYIKALNSWIKNNDDLIKQKVPETIEKAETALKKIWDIISYDPAIAEFGVVGYVIYGKKGAMIAGGLGHMVSWVDNFSKALGLASSGVIDFKQIASANFKELQKLVDDYDTRMDKLNKGPKFYKITMPKKEDKSYSGGLKSVVDNYKKLGNASSDTAKDLTLQKELVSKLSEHYRDLTGEITAYQREVKVVDSLIESYTEKLKKAGATETEITNIRKQAQETIYNIIDTQDQQKIDEIYGSLNDYIKETGVNLTPFETELKALNEHFDKQAELISKIKKEEVDLSGLRRQAADKLKESYETQKAAEADLKAEEDAGIKVKEYEDKIKRVGDAFASTMRIGIERGFEPAMAHAVDIFADGIEQMMSKAAQAKFGEMIGDNLGTGLFAQVAGSLTGALAGGFVSMAVGGLFNKGPSKATVRRREAEKQTKATEKNTDTLERNIEFLKSQFSSYSSSIYDASENIMSVFEGLKGYSENRDKYDNLDIASISNALQDELDKTATFKEEFAEKFRKGWFKGIAKQFKAEGKKARAEIELLQKALDEFTVHIEGIKETILSSARDIMRSAFDEFTPDVEVEKREFQKESKDMFIGLAETFRDQVTPVFTSGQVAYLNAVKDVAQASDIAQAMLANLDEGSAEYIQTNELLSTLFYTAIAKEKKRQEEIAEIYSESSSYLKEIRGEITPLDQAIDDMNERYNDLEKNIWNLTGLENALDDARTSSEIEIRKLYDSEGNLIVQTGSLAEDFETLRESMKQTAESIIDLQTDLSFRMSGMSRTDWIKEELTVIGDIFRTNGKLTEKEFQKAIGYVSEWYNLAISEEQKVIDGWKTVADKVKGMVNSIDNTIRNIKYGSLNVAPGMDQATAALIDYEKLKAAAMSGDEQAYNDFLNFAPQYLQIEQDIKKSSQAYVDIHTNVLKDLEELKQYVKSEDYQQLLYDTNKIIADEAKITNDRLQALSDELRNYTIAINDIIGQTTNTSIPTVSDVLSSNTQLSFSQITTPTPVTALSPEPTMTRAEWIAQYGSVLHSLSDMDLSGGMAYLKANNIPPIPSYLDGGIITYDHVANLHAPEAVIPLKNGSVPVDIRGGGSTPPVHNFQLNLVVQVEGEGEYEAKIDTRALKVNQDITLKAKRRGGKIPGRVYRHL